MLTESLDRESHFKEFIILWIGQLIAAVGHGISSFGIGVYVFQTTGTATSVSLVTLCAFLPSILLAPLAGVLADRFDRRLLMIIGDGVSGIGLFVMFLLYRSGHLSFALILLCVGFSSVFQALLDPCYRATVTDLLSEEDYSKASGMVQMASSAQYLFSPFIAGILLTVTNVGTLILIDILTVVITVITSFIVKNAIGTSKARDNSEDFWIDFSYGWNFVIKNKGILYLILLISLVTFYMGFLVILFQPLVLSFASPKELGIMQSAAAVGMLISSIILGIKAMEGSKLRALSTGLSLAGLFIAGLGLVRGIYLMTAVAFLFFCCLPVINAAVEVLLRKAIPNETQGRVWGIISVISQLGYVVAYAVSGPLADYVFNPLLEEGGALGGTFIGRIIGTGPSRGIGLLFVLSGILILIIGAVLPGIRSITGLEKTDLSEEII